MPVVVPREFADALVRRSGDVGRHWPEAVPALLAALTRAAALDPVKARAWTIVRAVDYWLWGLDHGFTEDPVRCHRLLDALAR